MLLLTPVDISVGDGCEGIAHYALNLLFHFACKKHEKTCHYTQIARL